MSSAGVMLMIPVDVLTESIAQMTLLMLKASSPSGPILQLSHVSFARLSLMWKPSRHDTSAGLPAAASRTRNPVRH